MTHFTGKLGEWGRPVVAQVDNNSWEQDGAVTSGLPWDPALAGGRPASSLPWDPALTTPGMQEGTDDPQ